MATGFNEVHAEETMRRLSRELAEAEEKIEKLKQSVKFWKEHYNNLYEARFHDLG